MKKIICSLIAASMITGTAAFCAEDAAAEETAAEEVAVEETVAEEAAAENEEVRTYTLSLEEAKEMAYTDNLRLEAIQYKKQGYDIALSSAKLKKGKNKNTEYSVSTQSAGLLVKKGYYVELYGSQSELTKLELEMVKNQISYNVTEKYYNYKLTEALVKTCETSSEIAASNLETVKKQFELGLAAQIDVDTAEAAYMGAKAKEDGYKRSLLLAGEDLKIVLNIEEPCKFVLTDSIDCPEFESDVEADVEKAMETRYDVKSLKENTRLAELNYTIIRNGLTDAAADTSNAKSSYAQAQYTEDNSIKNIKLGIRSAYNNIISAKSSMDIAQINVEIYRQKYKAGKLKFEMGMITNDELTSIMNDLSESEIEYEKTKLTYKLAVEKYGCEITIGL